jgi:multiple sugar transport system substrate-binding protein
MSTLFASRDSSYDIFNIDYNWVPEFAEAGHLRALDDAITDEGAFLPKALEVARYQGTLFGLPQTVHPHLLWYRQDLFDEAGLAPPATMDAWREAALALHGRVRGGQEIAGWGAQAVRGFGNVHTWLTFLYSFGGDTFTDYQTLRSTLDTPEALAATEFWAEMMHYTPPGIDDFAYDDVVSAAASGAIATCLHGSWGAFAVDDPATSSTVGKWEFVKVPAGRASVPHLAEWLLAVSSSSSRQDEAIAFIRCLESAENDVRQALLGGGDPVRGASYADPRLVEARVEGYPNLRRFRRYPQVLESMRTAKPRPLFTHEEQWETVVSTSLYAIQRGEASVRAGLARAQRDVEHMIRDLGYR